MVVYVLRYLKSMPHNQNATGNILLTSPFQETMKDKFIPLLMLVAIVAATVAFRNKWRDKADGIDLMAAALSTPSQQISNSTRLTFQNFPINNELHFQARYVMAPRRLPFHKDMFDTTLTVTPLPLKDSIRKVLADEHRRTLWQYADDRHDYIITTSN
jgi:hypothetical protein